MTVRKAKSTAKKSKVVKCQVKTFTSEGRCIGHDFFDAEEPAKTHAIALKEKNPKLRLVVALYEKTNLLEPSSYYEV